MVDLIEAYQNFRRGSLPVSSAETAPQSSGAATTAEVESSPAPSADFSEIVVKFRRDIHAILDGRKL